MLASFLKDWHSEDKETTLIFQQFIEKMVGVILNNFRSM
jgi:hypothetical protein